jgi:hypothetical protein
MVKIVLFHMLGYFKMERILKIFHGTRFYSGTPVEKHLFTTFHYKNVIFLSTKMKVATDKNVPWRFAVIKVLFEQPVFVVPGFDAVFGTVANMFSTIVCALTVLKRDVFFSFKISLEYSRGNKVSIISESNNGHNNKQN